MNPPLPLRSSTSSARIIRVVMGGAVALILLGLEEVARGREGNAKRQNS